jgi:FAD synthase
MEKYNIENLFLKEFDEEFRNLTGEEFVRQILIEKLNVKYLIIGYDHSFGKNKSGNFELLQKLSKELDFEVEQMEAINIHENNISSTKSAMHFQQEILKKPMKCWDTPTLFPEQLFTEEDRKNNRLSYRQYRNGIH